MRIVGLDIGPAQIKAVELESSFGRFELQDHHERVVGTHETPAQAAQALLLGLAKKPDRVVTSLATGQTTFRNLQLPTRDRKALQAAVTFELEDELPFASDQVAFNYSVLTQSKAGSTLHVAISLKKHLSAALSTEIDPDVLTTEGWGYRALVNRVRPASAPSPIILVHIRSHRTVIYAQSDTTPVLAREIPWGGVDLTQSVASGMGKSVEDAEQFKRAHGALPTTEQMSMAGGIGAEQLAFADAVTADLQNLTSEIRQSILTCKNLTRQAPTQIYLLGATGLIPGLSAHLEESLHIPVSPLRAMSSVGGSGVTYSETTDATHGLALGLALTQVGPEKSVVLQLRKGEFAKRSSSRTVDIKALRRPLISAGTVLFFMFLSLTIESQVYQSRLKDVDAQLEKSVKTFFGQLSGSAVRTYLSNTTTLKSSINKELTKQRELSRLLSPNPRSPTDFLKELSASVSPELVVDLMEYKVGAAPTSSFLTPPKGESEESATLTFWVANPQVAERLAQSVGSKLGQLQRGKMEEVTASDGTNKRWKITFSGKPTETPMGDKLREWKDQIQSWFAGLGDQVWAQELRSKWEELDPASRKYIQVGSIVAVALVCVAFIFGSLLSVRSLKNELGDKTDLLGLLQSANEEMRRLKETTAASAADASNAGPWNSYFESLLPGASIDASALTVSVEKPGGSTEAVKESYLDLTLKQVNIKQVVRLAHAIESGGRPVKLRNLSIDTHTDRSGYLDAVLSVSAFSWVTK